MRMLSIAAAAFVFANVALAVEEAKPVPDSSQAQQEGAPVGSPVQTSGKIVSMHNCALVGVADPHMVIKLETEQGDTDIVDLGSVAGLKTSGIEPKEGKQIWVDGRVGKINDKFLIVAERLSESKLVTIPRTAPLREETVAHAEARKDAKDGKDVIADAKDSKDTKDPKAPKTLSVDAGQQVRTVEGTVIHTRHIAIEGEAEKHILAKIQTEDGIAVIDLGICTAMPATVNLAEGQSLAATGFVGQLNGKPIIIADSIGNLVSIQRPADATPIPTSTTPATPVK